MGQHNFIIMNEQTNDSSAVFMEVVSKKQEQQEKKLAALEEKMSSQADTGELLQKISTILEGIQADMKSRLIPQEKLQHLTSRLDTVLFRFSQPLKTNVKHHHHFSQLIWITMGLFLILCLTGSGWYLAAGQLKNYVGNDTKYRWIRLDTVQRNLQMYLDTIDSLYNSDPEMRKKVLETEEEYRINLERLERAGRLREEAIKLEKAARKK
jgi:hypothetical protein